MLECNSALDDIAWAGQSRFLMSLYIKQEVEKINRVIWVKNQQQQSLEKGDGVELRGPGAINKPSVTGAKDRQ